MAYPGVTGGEAPRPVEFLTASCPLVESSPTNAIGSSVLGTSSDTGTEVMTDRITIYTPSATASARAKAPHDP
jgi:hypothetical protein